MAEVSPWQASEKILETSNHLISFRTGHPSQPGLGYLQELPLEIRSHIWQEIFQFRKIPDPFAIFRVSSQLHNEVTEHFYRNQTLTFSLPENKAYIKTQPLTVFCTKFDGANAWRELKYIDLGRFKLIEVDIEMPSDNRQSAQEFSKLETGIKAFLDLVQAWQSRRRRAGSPPSYARIKVVGRLSSSALKFHAPGKSGVQWEISSWTIVELLQPLVEIYNAEVATIDVRFKVRLGQQWLRQYCQHLEAVMHRRSFTRSPEQMLEAKQISWACRESDDLTQRTLYLREGEIPSLELIEAAERKVRFLKSTDYYWKQ
ncbi:MAG: hypothetical protein Q9223_005150 [Gallowayella weberi]